MPLLSFWEVENQLKNLDYMIAANEDQVLINDKLLFFFKKVEPFAVVERDRIYLKGRYGGHRAAVPNKV